MNELNEDLKKKYSDVYKIANNFLGNVLTNDLIKNKLITQSDKDLTNYLCDIISYQNYTENILHIDNNHLSWKYAQIISDLLNKRIQINQYEQLSPRKILIDVNYLKTYIQNIYHINKKLLDVNFNLENIDELKLISKKDRLLYKEKLLTSKISTGNQKTKTPMLLRKDFYPYNKKSNIIVWIKYGLSALIFLFGLMGIIAAATSGNSSLIFFAIFVLLLCGSIFYYLIKPIQLNILRIKFVFNYAYYIFIVLPVVVVSIIFISESVGFTKFNELFQSSKNILVFVFLIIAVLIIIVSSITLLFSPVLDRIKLDEAKKEFIQYQRNMANRFNNSYKNMNNSFKDDSDDENNKDTDST